MGYYIEVPKPKGKAQQLADLHGAPGNDTKRRIAGYSAHSGVRDSPPPEGSDNNGNRY